MHSIVHHGITISMLSADADIATYCAPGQSAIRAQPDGWWLYFVDSDGSIDGYEAPFASLDEAVWAAKAAAEFSAE